MGAASTTTHSDANRRFLVSDEQPPMCGHFRGSNITRVVSTVSEEHLESVWRLASLAPEIRFPVRGQCRDQRLGSYPTETGSHAGDWRLRIGKAEDPVLTRPLDRAIAETGDADPARQATFDRRFDQIGCQKGKRDRHVDLADAAFLARGDLFDISHGAGDDFIEPGPTTGD